VVAKHKEAIVPYIEVSDETFDEIVTFVAGRCR
jgi:hypothetical protein